MNENFSKTLKSVETEDWLDLHVVRPFCYWWAVLFAKLDIHPNTVTILSMFIGAASALLGFTTGFLGIYPVCYNFIQGLLVGLGGFLTGIISRFRPMTVCGIIASVLTFVSLFFQGDLWPWQFLVTAIVSVIALIISGHLLKQYVKHYGI